MLAQALLTDDGDDRDNNRAAPSGRRLRTPALHDADLLNLNGLLEKGGRLQEVPSGHAGLSGKGLRRFLAPEKPKGEIGCVLMHRINTSRNITKQRCAEGIFEDSNNSGTT